jgi:hypothetical protein
MQKRSLLATLAALVLAALAIAPTASAGTAPEQATSARTTLPVSGTVTNTFGGTVGTFSGAYNVQSVSSVAGEPVAIAILTGTITDARTGFPRPVVRTVTAPLDATTGAASGAMAAERTFAQVAESCPILDLSIGAVHLNLLGLVVHLDPVHLNITAESGDGALLGNLLCTVAHLLDPDGTGGGGLGDLGGLLDTVLGLLNQILGQLGLGGLGV